VFETVAEGSEPPAKEMECPKKQGMPRDEVMQGSAKTMESGNKSVSIDSEEMKQQRKKLRKTSLIALLVACAVFLFAIFLGECGEAAGDAHAIAQTLFYIVAIPFVVGGSIIMLIFGTLFLLSEMSGFVLGRLTKKSVPKPNSLF
jgi:hypothetical protein